jgi:hypothetical protein
MEAYVASEDEDLGPATLIIEYELPFFDKANFALFLNRHYHIRLNSVDACSGGRTEILHLDICRQRAALVESVRKGRGPRGFRFPVG